jgi:hypothetical protein
VVRSLGCLRSVRVFARYTSADRCRGNAAPAMSLPALLRTAHGADSPPVATSPQLLGAATDWDKELRGAAYMIERVRRVARYASTLCTIPIISGYFRSGYFRWGRWQSPSPHNLNNAFRESARRC